MDELHKTIRLHCTFCHSEQFAVPYKEYTPYSGSFVICVGCGRENDITSLLIIAKKAALNIAEDYAKQLVDDLKKSLTKSFKNSKYIKIK